MTSVFMGVSRRGRRTARIPSHGKTPGEPIEPHSVSLNILPCHKYGLYGSPTGRETRSWGVGRVVGMFAIILEGEWMCVTGYLNIYGRMVSIDKKRRLGREILSSLNDCILCKLNVLLEERKRHEEERFLLNHNQNRSRRNAFAKNRINKMMWRMVRRLSLLVLVNAWP